MCLAGADPAQGPGALVRGGSFIAGSSSGPLTVSSYDSPFLSGSTLGFRCAR
jgi:hypothetical protein